MNRDMKEGRVSRIQSCASRLNNTITGKQGQCWQALPPEAAPSNFRTIYIYIYLAIISRASTIKEKEKSLKNTITVKESI